MSLEIEVQTGQITRQLLGIANDLPDAIQGALYDEGAQLLDLTRTNTPIGPGPQGLRDNLPHIASSYSVVRDRGTVAIESSHPGAIVHEFGGTIAPRGVPITIHASEMALKAVQSRAQAIEEAVERRVDRVIRSHE